MKAQIHITGQIGGNFTLLSAIGHGEGKENGMFNSFWIKFNTIGEAKKALRSAWKSIKQDKEPNRFDGLTRDGYTLKYDASTAKIKTSTLK